MVENQQYDCYEVKLNRIFNIQNKQNLIWFSVLIALFIVYIVINLINRTVDRTESIVFGCGCLLIMIVKIFSSPKRLDVTPKTVKFQYRGALLHLLITGRIWINSDTESKYKKTFTLYNIKSIEYFQTPFEKTFSCGHICICGDVNIGAEGKEQRSFTIYGVKDFDNTSAWMKDYIELSADI